MINKDKVIKALKKLSKDERQYFAGYNMAEVKKQIGLQELAEDAIALLKEQEARIRELEEKLRALKYSDQDTLKNAMMPAT